VRTALFNKKILFKFATKILSRFNSRPDIGIDINICQSQSARLALKKDNINPRFMLTLFPLAGGVTAAE